MPTIYQYIVSERNLNGKDLENVLNKHSLDGWEPFNIIYSETGYIRMVIFRRPIEGAPYRG